MKKFIRKAAGYTLLSVGVAATFNISATAIDAKHESDNAKTYTELGNTAAAKKAKSNAKALTEIAYGEAGGGFLSILVAGSLLSREKDKKQKPKLG